MLSVCKNVVRLFGQAMRQTEQEICSSSKGFLNVSDCCAHQKQNFHTSTPRKKVDVELDIRKAAKESSKKTLVVEDFNIDVQAVRKEGVFPTVNLPDTLFDGVPFKHLPIIYIKVSRNNTILSLVDEGMLQSACVSHLILLCGQNKDGKTMLLQAERATEAASNILQPRDAKAPNVVKVSRSCGTEGFKNSRKGTNIAAQTAGTALGMRALKKGYKTARVIIKGLGPGRLSGVKGIQLAGMNIVSITDDTKASTHLRPRKQRRI